MLADLELAGKALRQHREEGQAGRQGSEGTRRLDACAPWCCCAKASPRAWLSARTKRRRPFAASAFCPSKPVLYVCNVEEASCRQGQCLLRQGEGLAPRRKATRPWSFPRRSKAKSPFCRRRPEGLSRCRGPARAGPQPRHPRRLCAARPADLFHRRPEGSPGLDHHQGHQGPAGGGRHPHRFREGLHPVRDHRL